MKGHSPEVIFPLALLFVLLSRLISVLLHELGHAFMAFYFRKENVQVFVGSFGNEKDSFHFPLGKLQLFVRQNPFRWFHGLCRWKENRVVDFSTQAKIIIAGPLASLVGVVATGIVSEQVGTKTITGLFFYILCWSFAADVVNALITTGKKKTATGQYVWSDLVSFLNCLSYHKLIKKQPIIQRFLKGEDYALVAPEMETILNNGELHPKFIRHTIQAFSNLKNYEAIVRIHQKVRGKWTPTVDDITFIGSALVNCGKHQDAVILLNEALQVAPHNPYLLNNRGCALMGLLEFEKAIEDFKKVAEDESPIRSTALQNLAAAKQKRTMLSAN